MAKKIATKTKIKVEVLKPIYNYGYFVGDKFEVDSVKAEEWKQLGLVK